MDTFHFELVSPEKLVFSGDVKQVDIPGEEGEFGVFAGHAPYVATLKPGVITIYGDNTQRRIVVRAGFAEIGSSGALTVLAESATPVDELDPAEITQAVQDAEEDVTDAKDAATRDKALKRLDQLRLLQQALGR